MTAAHVPLWLVWTAAEVALIGLVWLLRGGTAVIRACAASGLALLLFGLADGRLVTAACGAVIAAVDGWCLFSLRGDR